MSMRSTQIVTDGASEAQDKADVLRRAACEAAAACSSSEAVEKRSGWIWN